MTRERQRRMGRWMVAMSVAVLPWVTGCGGGSVSGPTELPGEVVDLREGSAMLKIERSWEAAGLGLFELDADFTLRVVGLPGATNDVTGSYDGEFGAMLFGYGTGGAHQATTSGPARYEVTGFFHPGTKGCAIELVVTETIFFSQVQEVQSTILGSIPTDAGGLGEDTTTVFRPEFDEESQDFFVIAGGYVASFSLYDIVPPAGSNCDFAR